MGEVKFGTGQWNRPAPPGYRLFANAYIMFFGPALLTFIGDLSQFMHWDEATQNFSIKIIGFSMAVVKGVGFMLGNTQNFTSPKNIDKDKNSTNQSP